MTRETLRVTFQPEGRSVFVLRGAKIVEAAGQAGLVLNQPCGGEGTCGKCRVEVLENAPEPTPADLRHFSPEEIKGGWRLACQLAVVSNLVVSIPQETRFFEQVVLTEGEGARHPFQPNVRKAFAHVVEASVTDQRSDVDRLRAVMGGEGLKVDLALVRELPAILRRNGHHVTVVLEGDQIQSVEPGDTRGSLWGVAFDVGTTTLVATLMDLTDRAEGRTQVVTSRTNPQVHFGDDVVSRITYAAGHTDGLDRLRKRLTACLNEMVLELCEKAGAEPEDVYEGTVVGNTTMSHILLGVDPAPIGRAPYVSVVREAVDIAAREAGLEINRNANLHVLPNIAGFVGSDTVGVVLASGMADGDDVVMAIDIGTNGEVVIGNRQRLVACSCAAGPAFEGARIRFGMRATEGAISKVVINDAVEVGVIGGGMASGICGSGLIDAVAELRAAGIVDPTGRILESEEALRQAGALGRIVTEFEGQMAVELVAGGSSKTGRAMMLTQRDIREVQLAKAAIRAGIEVIAAEFGVDPCGVSRILLAGGFGNFIRRSNARRIGLLPDIGTERIEFIGNAASAGAKMALACRDCRRAAETVSQRTEYIELAARPEFQSSYVEAMTFPEL
jgi:uncharacterized 2Fe-2S/4Fe-4S cluster protein (DUF4445 family)